MKRGQRRDPEISGKLEVRSNELGGALLEMALILALIIMLAVPSVERVGIGVKYTVCAYQHDGIVTNLVEGGLFDFETGECRKATMIPSLPGGNGGGTYF